MSGMIQDLRYAVRTLKLNPGFALVAILTLGIGIGATTGQFSLVEAFVLRSLPFAQADRLVHVWATDRPSAGATGLGTQLPRPGGPEHGIRESGQGIRCMERGLPGRYRFRFLAWRSQFCWINVRSARPGISS